jgi:hypothetical protein
MMALVQRHGFEISLIYPWDFLGFFPSAGTGQAR